MLLCRFYEPDEGEILIGGLPIRSIPIASYYKLLGVAFQDSQLFAGTVRENISYSDTALGDIQNSLKVSTLSEKISSLPMKLDTVLGKSYDENGIFGRRKSEARHSTCRLHRCSDNDIR